MKTINEHDVIIHEMNGKGSFPIKGTIMKKYPKNHIPLRYEIWMKNGRCFPLKQSNWDLNLDKE